MGSILEMVQQIKEKLDKAATLLMQARKLCEEVELDSPIDKKAMKIILTDINWAIENCTVIGLHSISEALDDNMGYENGL